MREGLEVEQEQREVILSGFALSAKLVRASLDIVQ